VLKMLAKGTYIENATKLEVCPQQDFLLIFVGKDKAKRQHLRVQCPSRFLP
jgi:hypothetical protein